MNSVRFIGSRVENLLDNAGNRAHETFKPHNRPGHSSSNTTTRLSIWTLLWSILTFQWGILARVIRSHTSEVPSAQNEKRQSLEPAESSKPGVRLGSLPGSPRSTSSRKSSETSSSSLKPRTRASRSSISLLKNPLSWRDQEKKTLVLDLDETLIHSMSRSHNLGASHMVEVELSNQMKCIYFVEKRPYCDYFLSLVSQWYNVAIFTASVQSYADPMIDWLEQGKHLFTRRLYRPDCISTPVGYVKDLKVLGEELSRVFLVDNSPISYSMQKYNGIGIEGWISDPSDACLLHMLPLLNALRFTTDVRSILCLQDGEAFASDA